MSERVEPATKGIVNIEKKPDEISVATFLMGQNRAYRRGFKRQNGIFLRGSMKPFVKPKN